MSANAIHRFCGHALRAAGVADDEWTISYSGEADDDEPAGSEFKALQLEFWTAARSSLVESGVFPSVRNPPAQMWFDLALGRSGIHISLLVSFRERRVGAKIVIGPHRVERALPQLTSQKVTIEQELGFSLDWDPYPEKKIRTLAYWRPLDVSSRDNWAEAIQWLTSVAARMYRVFAPRVARLEL
jgi:hypothetical protein